MGAEKAPDRAFASENAEVTQTAGMIAMTTLLLIALAFALGIFIGNRLRSTIDRANGFDEGFKAAKRYLLESDKRS